MSMAAVDEPMSWGEDALGFDSWDDEEQETLVQEEPAPKAAKPGGQTPRILLDHGNTDIIMQHANYSYNNLSLPGKSSTADKVLNLLARETGVAKSNLLDNYRFEEDLGIDLYSAFDILGQMREELELYNISSDLFTEYPTVGELKQYFTAMESSAVTPLSQIWNDSDSDDSMELSDTEATSFAPTRHASPPAVPDEMVAKYTALMRSIVMREIELAEYQVDEDKDLEDMGMDSLLALVILGELREATEIYGLPSNFLTANNTINLVGKALAFEVQLAGK
ncbi:Non-reducing polyketide synthase 1 [Pseudocercospora fuligena]|uniref:Non-reducing polyketide synthase 1 n=1 Tax=Pseudocercospora fuligena TaxID=685502 RepID=A0A8H6VEZ9_9PEZI|nr:Non-reducing polyketide synthase 1 [Pseudocercospora fuligena]